MRHRRVLVAVVFLLPLLLAVQCQKPCTKYSLGYVSTGLTGLAIRVMVDQGIPERYGITFQDMSYVSPKAATEALSAGQYDIGLAAGAAAVAAARDKGIRLQYFFPTLTVSSSLLCRRDAPFTSLADLKGKKIGWQGLEIPGGAGFTALAVKLGYKPGKDFKLVTADPASLMMMLFRRDVDAVVLTEPFVSKALAAPWTRELLGPFDKEWQKLTGNKTMDVAGMAASEDWIKSHPDCPRKLIMIWRETVRYIRSNPTAVLQRYGEYTHLKTEGELAQGLERIPGLFQDGWGDTEASLTTMLGLLAQDGVLFTTVPGNIFRKTE